MESPKGRVPHKLNLDGSLSLRADLTRMRGIIGDAESALIAAFLGAVKPDHPLEAELEILLQGIIVAQSMRIKYLEIEGDCLILAENLQRAGTIP